MKKILINGDLDKEILVVVADKVTDQCGTDESSRQSDDQPIVKGRPSVKRTQSKGDLNLNYRMKWPIKEEIGKRKKKHTARWLEYQ